MKYCPCCGEEYNKDDHTCLNCKLPLLSGKCPEIFSHLCECDKISLGVSLTNQLSEAISPVEEKIKEITGLVDKKHIKIYMFQMVIYNS